MLDDGLHSDTATLSTEKLGGQIATINHLLSANLQATHGSLSGAPQTPLHSIAVCSPLLFSQRVCVCYVPLFLSEASLSAFDQTLFSSSLGNLRLPLSGSELV